MVIKKLHILKAFLAFLSFASGDEAKGSVTFVIDDTISMKSELAQVKARTDDIFEAVLKSNASQIDEFIIVTFNDPLVNFRVKTNESLEFKSALGEIMPHGGKDCPEMAMTGIQLALWMSKPHSFLYVYTDAFAKDYRIYDEVKNLAQQKSIQVNFLLTGECSNKTIEEQHTVYDHLATATLGQVFHILKDDIDKITEYILANLRSKRINLLRKTYGYSCENSAFIVDSKVWEILIALSSPAPLNHNDLVVHGPHGDLPSLEEFIYSENTFIFKMRGEPGEYTIKIQDCADITVVVSAATSVSFRHGFSSVKPSTLDETSTKPVLGTKSYLAIALTNEGRDVTLKSVEIRDMDNNLAAPLLTLQLIDDEKQFYITDSFTPPNETFTIAVIGYTKSNEKITRVSQTTIEYHETQSEEENHIKIPPQVTVIGPREVPVEYHKSVELKCKVNGIPKPRIWWEDEFLHFMPDSKVIEIAPFEYITTLHILCNVTNKVTFICLAKNFAANSDNVTVIVENKSFLNVLEYPKDITVEFGNIVELNFKIDAQPPAKIDWYQDDVELKNNEGMEIITSSEGSSLKIKSATPSLEGKYFVMASNVYHKQKYEFKITVTTKERAALVTILGGNEVTAYDESSLTLNCKVEGFPEPNITWEDQYHNVLPSKITKKTPPYEYISTLHIDKVTETGTYICKAKNFKEDSGSVKVIIEKKTFFNILEYPKDKTVEFGDYVEMNLKIDAQPPAKINWYRDDVEINNNEDMEIITSSEGSSLKIKSASPSQEGKYYVMASNVHHKEKYEFEITVTTKKKAAIVTILEENAVTTDDELSLTLNCKVEGFPEPSITWEDQYHNVLPSKITRKNPPYEYISTLQLDKATASGTYICKAKNFEEDSDSIKVQQKTFFKVLEYPKDTVVKYGESVELNFRIHTKPPAKIIWYRNNTEIKSNNHFRVSVDSSVLKITNAQPGIQGKYYVKASNNDKQVEYEFHVLVTGTELPRIDKNKISYTKLRGRSVDIECRLIQGKPAPVISWSFDRDFAGKFIKLEETRDKVHIDHVTKNDVGTYRCDVSNEIGTDHHEAELYVEYAPIIKIPSKSIKSIKDKPVKLACMVDGSPAPFVRWLVNDSPINNGSKFTIYPDYTLRFTGLISDSGTYSCEAWNHWNRVRAEVSVIIYVPTKIKPPLESKFDVKLRSTLVLPCEVNGYPEPKVQWLHYPTELSRKSKPEKINCDKNYNVILHNIQFKDEGFYHCTADNNIESDEITYTVNVQVPAAIDHKMVTNVLQVVEGDLSFVLTCPATGSPKPTIKWQRDEIEIGSDASFKISKDGSLTVNNVVSRHRGTYTCTAQNQYNKDTINYEVNVHPFPPFESNPLLITIIEGEKKHYMRCGIIPEKELVFRWFKDAVFIREGDLTLIDVSKNDAGFYTCRISTPRRSYSFHKRVIVGTEPKFITAHNPTVMFKDGAEATFDCSATGDPLPTINWWYENTKITNANSNQYTFKMDINNIGNYSCHVSNEFRTIKRSFDITAAECLMSLENDFTARQPMLVTGKKKRQWPIFKVSGGVLRMQKYREFKLICPNAVISYDNRTYGSILETSCVGDSMFELGGRAVKASEITCNQPMVPIAKNTTDFKCRGSNTKLFYVGFDVYGAFMPVFSVCLNETTNTTLFVTHRMHKAIAGIIPKYVAGYTRGTLLRIQFEDIYDCKNQEYAISTFMGKTVSGKCCFKRQQLVNPMDVLPGISQVATYHYLNVVPRWSCGTENWEEVEQRVRQYAINSQDKIRIWTGATSVLNNVRTINLKDNLGQELQVPQFIWKVVERQLAIIHINVPGLTAHQAKYYTRCIDICDSIDWMRNSQWHDFDKGFIYCCAIKEFERAFNYDYIFN